MVNEAVDDQVKLQAESSNGFSLVRFRTNDNSDELLYIIKGAVDWRDLESKWDHFTFTSDDYDSLKDAVDDFLYEFDYEFEEVNIRADLTF